MRQKRLFAALTAVMVLTAACSGGKYALGNLPKTLHSHSHENEKVSTSTGCGVERWPVKTGTDADVGKVNLNTVTDTTIEKLSSLRAPATLPQNSRVSPVEDTIFRVHAILREYKLESDHDIHLVLDDQGRTMIAEIPDPSCVGSSSPFLPGIRHARNQFDLLFHPETSWQGSAEPVTVTGVGFFDFLHGQTGVAPDGIEIHPVLDIQFGS